MGDDDQRLALAALRRLERRLVTTSDQLADDTLDDLANVVAALAQVDIVDLLELIDQDLHLLDDGPLGVATPFADDLLGHVAQFRVRQNHQVQVDERTEIGRRAVHPLLDCGKLAAHTCQGRFETRDFLFDEAR